jgi:opacity protein-like surface antigen
MGEVGYRVAPNLFVVGNLGQFHNLQPSSIQPSIDDETLTLLNSGLTVTGTAQAPAWFTTGGVRYEIPLRKRIAPYVFTGIGFARMTPTAQFTYGSGTLLGSSPNPGDDVTPQLLALGDYIQPPSENAFMFSAGAGINAPLAPHFGLDIGYRLSHMAFDQPITAQSVTFGIGYRF